MTPETTALILVGYQNDYFAPEGILRGVVEEPKRVDQVLANSLAFITAMAPTAMTIVAMSIVAMTIVAMTPVAMAPVAMAIAAVTTTAMRRAGGERAMRGT